MQEIKLNSIRDPLPETNKEERVRVIISGQVPVTDAYQLICAHPEIDGIECCGEFYTRKAIGQMSPDMNLGNLGGGLRPPDAAPETGPRLHPRRPLFTDLLAANPYRAVIEHLQGTTAARELTADEASRHGAGLTTAVDIRPQAGTENTAWGRAIAPAPAVFDEWIMDSPTYTAQ